MESRSRWREQRRVRKIRGGVTAALVFLLAVMLLLFLLTFFGRTPAQKKFSEGELQTVRADAKAAGRAPLTAEVYEFSAEDASVRAELQSLVMPVDGSLTSGYGLREDPLTGNPDFHPAVDIAAPAGAPISAAADGIVRETGWNSSYGNYVKVWHGDGIETQYGHCQTLLCEPGDAVAAGDVIALVGMTGRATGYHLDFQVLVNGENADPANWLSLS